MQLLSLRMSAYPLRYSLRALALTHKCVFKYICLEIQSTAVWLLTYAHVYVYTHLMIKLHHLALTAPM